MTEIVTSGSMSGAKKRNDGLLGEGSRRRQLQAPPGLHVTALRLDSTGRTGVGAQPRGLSKSQPTSAAPGKSGWAVVHVGSLKPFVVASDASACKFLQGVRL